MIALGKLSVHARASILALPLLVCLPLALAGLDESSSLAYSRTALMEKGQYWRLLTAHLVHIDLPHALLNLAAWPLIFWLAQSRLSGCQWMTGLLFCAFGVSVGLWFFSPTVQWYVGLSGVLHGLLVLSALTVWWQQPVLTLLVLLGVIAKLLWEQTQGSLPGSAVWIGHPVIVDAHLFGALSGVICAFFYALSFALISKICR